MKFRININEKKKFIFSTGKSKTVEIQVVPKVSALSCVGIICKNPSYAKRIEEE